MILLLLYIVFLCVDREQKRPLSVLELRAAERDLKRQRQKYKTTHTGKKSHKEVQSQCLHAVIIILTADDWVTTVGQHQDLSRYCYIEL